MAGMEYWGAVAGGFVLLLSGAPQNWCNDIFKLKLLRGSPKLMVTDFQTETFTPPKPSRHSPTRQEYLRGLVTAEEAKAEGLEK